MKNVWAVLTANLLALCLVSTSVFAQGPAPATNARLFYESTSSANWANTEALYRKFGVIVGDELIPDKQLEVAQGIAKEQKHPAATLAKDEFAKAYFDQNPALPAGGKIKVDAYLKLAQGPGIFLPNAPIAPVAKTEMVAPVVAAAATVAAPSAAPVAEASVLAKQAIEIANLSGRVEEMQQAAAKSGGDQKQITALTATVKLLQGQLKTLTDRQDGLAQKGEVSPKLAGQIADIEMKIGNLQLEVDSAEAKVIAKLDPRLQAIETDNTQQNTVLAIVGLLSALGMFALWRRTIAVKRVSDQALAKAKEVEGNLEVVHGQIGRLDIKIPNDLENALQAMKLEDEYRATIEVDGRPFVLDFIGAPGGVKIAGIVSQENAVRIDNVIKRIKRAAGQGHLVGVHQSEAARLRAVT